jgi:hypothetical protein
VELRPAPRPEPRPGLLTLAAALAAVTILLAAAPAAEAASSQAVSAAPTLTRPASERLPPPEHFLSAREVKRIAAREPKLQRELDRHAIVRAEAFAKGPGRWQVSYYADGDEVAQVVVDERTGRAVEVWTGPQVAWQMARGLPGAFGRGFNSPGVWAFLIVAFLLPLVDWRRPLRLLHLDLLVLLAFAVSHVFFNRGEISTSVPLVYPVLAYLLARMLTIGFAARDALPLPPKLPVPVRYLALGLVFLVGFRVGFNITNSNVIDVGYSGVIGADRITHGVDLYGSFPQGNLSGDTYGPVNYLAYVPFELVFPWSGRWDSLPAAHAAAIFFDLATIVALIFAGRSLIPGEGGNRLGLTLGYAWAAYPYTLFVSNSNANDSLVALLVVLAFLALRSAPGRGALLGLAAAAKFAPAALAPLFAGYDRSRPRGALVFAATFSAVVALLLLVFLPDGGPRELWDRTIGFQLGRDSPFSIWGQEEWLAPLHTAVEAAAVVLALVVGFYPRRKSPLQVAALGAAVLIALQLGLSHWFYLYIVWWFPLVLIALLARGPGSARSSLPLHSRPTSPGTPSPTGLDRPSRSGRASG